MNILGQIRYFLIMFFVFVSLLCITPICIVRPFHAGNTGYFFLFFNTLCKYIAGVRLKLEGKELLDQNRPSVIISNHQHNIDILAAGSMFAGNQIVLGKKELGFIPIFGQIFVLAGNILIHRGNKEKSMASMNRIEKILKEKSLSILIFPEGHRNPKKDLLPFKKGAFYTAIKTQIPILPVSVSQYARFKQLNKFKLADIYVKVHAPLSTLGLSNEDIPRLVEESKRLNGTTR